MPMHIGLAIRLLSLAIWVRFVVSRLLGLELFSLPLPVHRVVYRLLGDLLFLGLPFAPRQSCAGARAVEVEADLAGAGYLPRRFVSLLSAVRAPDQHLA